MMFRFARSFFSFAALLASACVDREFISVDDDPIARPIGDSCTVDADCSSGRCIAGICDDDQCGNDNDCRDSEICVFGACEDVDAFACQPDQRPLISVSPGLALDFGQVNLGQTGEEILTIENVGDCLLTISAAGLDDAGAPGFGCEPCDPEVYPQRVPPNQTLDILVRYAPPGPGDADNTLFLRTDDVTAGDEGLVAVDLHADYDGEPLLVINPPELNFGRVEFVAGGAVGESTETFEITNRGTGNAVLVIERLFMDEGVDFTIPEEFAAVTPDSPLFVPPYDPNDASTTIVLPVTLRPTRNADMEDKLFVRTQGSVSPVQRLVRGTSLGPPAIRVLAGGDDCVDGCEFIYKCGVGVPAGVTDPCPLNEAYPTGVVAFRTVTILNEGASALEVSLTLGGEAGDYSFSPTFIPSIPAGGQLPVTVFYQPSGPSDPLNAQNPVESTDAVLNITSNDTSPVTDALRSIALHGFSKGGQDDQVLKLEMVYENADNSWAGNDFRDVDLELISPSGFSCTKPLRQFNNNGDLISEEDPCEDWNAFGQEGTTNWVSVGQFEEPERVILFGLGPTGSEGDTFIARIHYQQDCANIPTGLLADIIGISGSILLGILGGAVGVPVTVPPDQISDFVSQNCFDHDGSTTTVHIALDGQIVSSPQHRLNNRGEFFDIAHLQRLDGRFCDPAVGIVCE